MSWMNENYWGQFTWQFVLIGTCKETEACFSLTYQHPFVMVLLQVNKRLENFHLLVALGGLVGLRGRQLVGLGTPAFPRCRTSPGRGWGSGGWRLPGSVLLRVHSSQVRDSPSSDTDSLLPLGKALTLGQFLPTSLSWLFKNLLQGH